MKSEPPREEALFQAAAQLTGSSRAAFLDQACATDAALRQRLDATAQRGVRPASAIEISRAGFRRGALERLGEHGLLGRGGLHGSRFIAHTCAI